MTVGTGKIAHYQGNGRVAAIDGTTALWAARMLMGEGWKNGKGAAVLWATMYRFLGMPHRWDSYLEMIRLFSQPINDRWLPGGDLYETYRHSPKEVYRRATSAEAVARRQKIQSLEWSEMPEACKRIVTEFALGNLLPPAEFGRLKYSNFASYEGVDQKYPDGIRIGGDWFFVDPNLKTDWTLTIRKNVGTSIPQKEVKKKTVMN